MGRIIITEEELDQSIFHFGHSKEGVRCELFFFLFSCQILRILISKMQVSYLKPRKKSLHLLLMVQQRIAALTYSCFDKKKTTKV